MTTHHRSPSFRVTTSRRYAIEIGLKIAAIALLDFLLLRILAPDLVNMHQDLALAGAILCIALAIAATGWLGLQLWSYRTRSVHEGRHIEPPRGSE